MPMRTSVAGSETRPPACVRGLALSRTPAQTGSRECERASERTPVASECESARAGCRREIEGAGTAEQSSGREREKNGTKPRQHANATACQERTGIAWAWGGGGGAQEVSGAKLGQRENRTAGSAVRSSTGDRENWCCERKQEREKSRPKPDEVPVSGPKREERDPQRDWAGQSCRCKWDGM
uniref:Uncharacterized protein n=1 Tax=Anopheles coluzzii TaxID=1518534 RepID=A0A8W7P4T3_ANOCL